MTNETPNPAPHAQTVKSVRDLNNCDFVGIWTLEFVISRALSRTQYDTKRVLSKTYLLSAGNCRLLQFSRIKELIKKLHELLRAKLRHTDARACKPLLYHARTLFNLGFVLFKSGKRVRVHFRSVLSPREELLKPLHASRLKS